MSIRDEIVQMCRMSQLAASRGFPQESDATGLADAILDLLRRELTSDRAVEAADKARNGTAVWDFMEQIVEGEEGSTFDVLTAALDAALGAGGAGE